MHPYCVVSYSLSLSRLAYQGMDVRTLTADDIHVAQRQLWILDGLYGMLRPLDCIQPYR